MKLHSVIPALALCIGFSLFAQSPQQPPPPEMAELRAASQIANHADRIKELQRIKAAYPESPLARTINSMLLDSVTKNADTLDNVLSAQNEIIAPSSPAERIELVAGAAVLLIGHEKLDSFPKDGVLKAIQKYKAQGIELLANPEVIALIPEARRDDVIAQVKNFFEIPIAKAQLLNGDSRAALATLMEYRKTQEPSSEYYSLLGDIYLRESLEAFFAAAIDGDSAAADKARELYIKINGDASKFDEELERKQSALPFHPPAFVAPAHWKGKTVLAELFTGSECPPCVAADFAFDGFIESYPSKYLAILEYHLPIPGPDPMMNPATKKRQDYYSVSSTPTVIIDGTKRVSAGGLRQHAKDRFDSIKAEIDPAMAAATDVTIKATARLQGDKVIVDCEFSRVIRSAEYQVVLVQTEEKHKGGNGIIFHKMVVRDMETVKPSTKVSATFDIPKSEKAADAHLSELEQAPRWQTRNFKWPVRRNIIDRDKLKVVVFVQDINTKQVNNAFVADVVKR